MRVWRSIFIVILKPLNIADWHIKYQFEFRVYHNIMNNPTLCFLVGIEITSGFLKPTKISHLILSPSYIIPVLQVSGGAYLQLIILNLLNKADWHF